MEQNQSSAEIVESITPEKVNSDVILEKESLAPEKVTDENAQAKMRKGGILRRVAQTPDRMQRSRTDISISKFRQKKPESACKDQPQITLKPSKIKAPCIYTKKEHSSVTEKSSYQRRLISRKKSKSSLELQTQKIRTEPETIMKPNEVSNPCRLPTPVSVVKLWSISSAAIQAPSFPPKAIHKLGTLPPYLVRNKANSLQTQVKKRQKAFDNDKNALMQLQAKLVKKHEDLVKDQERLKNSGAKDIVLEKLELLPINSAKTGTGDAVDPVVQSEALELANYNILRYVEGEMKKISDSYLKLCQDFLDENFTKELNYSNSETEEDYRRFLNISVSKLTETITQMKIEQETALSNCQLELKSMMISNIKGGTSKSVQELITKTEQQNAKQIQQLNEQIEVLRTKVLAAEQQNRVLEKTKTDNETNREKSLKTIIFNKEKDINKGLDKCHQLDILNKKHQRKITELETKMEEPIAEAKRLSKDLEDNTKFLADSIQQCAKLKVQVSEMRRQHQQNITEIEEKLSKEREEKNKVQADLIQAKEVIEKIRNQPVELNSSESHQCIINEMEEKIQHLVQERDRLLNTSIPDITQHNQKINTLEASLAKYDRRLQHKKSVIHKLEHHLKEETKRLYETGASLQAEIVNLKRVDEEKQSELDSLRTQLSQAIAELRQKDETIGMNQRLLRIRDELLKLNRRECQQNHETRSEEFSNLFSTLTHKQIALSQQHSIIKRLEEHHVRNVLAQSMQIMRFKEIEAENSRLRLELSAYSRPRSSVETLQPSTSSVENLQNNIDLTADLDRNEMYINDRKHKRKSKVNIKMIK